MTNISSHDEERLSALRERARLLGLGVMQSTSPISEANRGGFLIYALPSTMVLAGPDFSLTLSEAEQFVANGPDLLSSDTDREWVHDASISMFEKIICVKGVTGHISTRQFRRIGSKYCLSGLIAPLASQDVMDLTDSDVDHDSADFGFEIEPLGAGLIRISFIQHSQCMGAVAQSVALPIDLLKEVAYSRFATAAEADEWSKLEAKMIAARTLEQHDPEPCAD